MLGLIYLLRCYIKIIFNGVRDFSDQIFKPCSDFKVHPVERLVSVYACVNTCAQQRSVLSSAVAFYLPHFLLCLLEGSTAILLPPPPDGSHPPESSTASGTAQSNRLVTPAGVSFPPRGSTNGISGQSNWQVKFSPGLDSMAPLNPRLKATREKDFLGKRRRSRHKKLFR